METVIVVGGGLAGLISAIRLAKNGVSCTLIEKKRYPFHRVCGEYISNEVVPFLESLECYPAQFAPSRITRLQLSSVSGLSQELTLDLGGFGISRFLFDNFLYQKASALGVRFILDTAVESVEFMGQSFRIKAGHEEIDGQIVLGCFGKRSTLDVQMNRSFITKRSPYVGVKYHVNIDHPNDLIALHNFPGGYCGVSKVEQNKVNMCYLVHRDTLKRNRNIRDMEQRVLSVNPHLAQIIGTGEFLFEKPETINEISFETKAPVENHMLMVGDAAGMITPLCGNGMAMAIHSAKIATDTILRFVSNKTFNRSEFERYYARRWNEQFRTRLWIGRQVQRLFGSQITSNIAVNLATHMPGLANQIIKRTHGKTF